MPTWKISAGALAVLLIVLTLATPAIAAAPSINSDNYDPIVAEDHRVWSLKVFRSSCGRCEEFRDTYDEFSLSDIGRFWQHGHIDLDDVKGMELARRLKIATEDVPGVYIISGRDRPPLPVKIMAGSSSLTAEALRRVFVTALQDHGWAQAFNTEITSAPHVLLRHDADL
jgi:hypothetical protein